MARISSYPKDTTVQDNDAWVGTASPNRQTKNFLASDVAKYLNIKGKISVSAQMVYEFKSDPNEAGIGDFYGVSDNTDFSTITSLNISATDKGNQNVVNFITYLVDSDILISEQKNISSFGHYKITAYTDNGDGFYTLTLSYLGGGGSVGNKKFYDIANFSIAKLGDITAVNAGTYLNGGGSSGDVTLNHDLTSRTNTTSSVTPGYGGTFTAIDSVVTNTTGHITTVNTKTVTIPDSGVDGNGTTNYVAKWLDADTIQNSIIFDNGTNVGIGTISPSEKLEVVDGNVKITDGYLRVNSTNGANIYASPVSKSVEIWAVSSELGGDPAFRIRQDSSTKVDFGWDDDGTSEAFIWNYSNGGFKIGTNGSERFKITSSGNVGIGTTNPSEKLEIAGNARITGDVTLSNGNALRWTSDDVRIEGTTAGDNIKFYVANTEILQLAQSGTLATVTGNLRVTGAYYDSNNLPGTSGQVLSSTATGTDWVSLSEISGVDGTGTTNYVAKWSDTDTITDSVIYDNGTNVGIGTTSPSQKLTIRDDSTTVYSTGDASTNTGDLVLQNNDETDNNFNRISFQSNSDNNQTGDLLDAARITAIYPDHAGGNPSGELAFETKADAGSMSEAMRIDRDGNVGIGTTSPGAKLHVTGQIGAYDATNSYSMELQANSSFGYLQTNAPLIYINKEIRVDTGLIGSYNEDLQLKTSGTTRIIVNNSTGYVGIGETNPLEKLHVKEGNVLIQGGLSTTSQSELGFTNVFDTAFIRSRYTDPSATTETYLAFHTNTSGDSNNTVAEQMRIAGNKVGIGTTTPSSKLQVAGGVQMADDTDAASVDKVGTLRYRTSGNNSYVDMCMQTGATTYEWVNIVQNNW